MSGPTSRAMLALPGHSQRRPTVTEDEQQPDDLDVPEADREHVKGGGKGNDAPPRPTGGIVAPDFAKMTPVDPLDAG
jgi:hypothetical protein